MKKKEEDLIYDITNELPTILGENYEVFPYFLSTQFSVTSTSGSAARPDFFVRNKDKDSMTIVEIKGSEPSDELPLATGTYVRNLKNLYEDYEPKVILITMSGITQTLDKKLKKENVSVIKFQDNKQTISDLVTVIEEQEKRPIKKTHTID